MICSTCVVATPNASRYIRMLCKHFAHKVPAEYTENRGDCQLPPGPAVMLASADSLRFEVSAENLEGIERARYIIEDHLIRFARKEGIESLDWQEPTACSN